jgi:hypothetical protein
MAGVDKERFDDEVADATLLLDFAISSGFTTADGRKVDDELVNAIKHAQDLAGKPDLPGADERAAFERAYRDLAQLLAPVTADTLKATSDDYGQKSYLAPVGRKSVAIIWSRKLSGWTMLFVVIALAGNWLEEVYGPLPQGGEQALETYPPLLQSLQILLQILVPFTYGAIGSCVYLLKCIQFFIHTRQFDPLRKTEYYNRMILGAVSGGMIVILVHQISVDDEGVVQLSAAALGFLAGYNTDLLFAAIERISNALLPKIDLTTVRRAPTRTNAVNIDASLKDLLDLHQKTTNPDDKKLIAGLIQKIQDRL